MDTQLQELLDTIKTEGIQTADKQAEQIIASAEEKARDIVEDAQKRAKGMLDAARAEQEKLDAAGREALAQAARDVLLSVRKQLQAVFAAVVSDAASETVSGKVLEDAVVSVVNSWSAGRDEPLDVILAESDLSALERELRSRLATHLGTGTEIKGSPAVRSGFRVSTRNGGLYYDFSAETIAEALSAYVVPRLSEVLKTASADASNA